MTETPSRPKAGSLRRRVSAFPQSHDLPFPLLPVIQSPWRQLCGVCGPSFCPHSPAETSKRREAGDPEVQSRRNDAPSPHFPPVP